MGAACATRAAREVEGAPGAYEQLLADEQSVKLDRVEIHIPPGPRLGDLVIEADGVAKGFGDRLLVEGLTFSLPPAGIVGVIGPNGAGKTTLFRMIAGEETADAGNAADRRHRALAYVDQSRADLDPKNTVWKEISGGQDAIVLGKREVNSRQYISLVQLQGRRPAEAGRQALRRRAQPRSPREAAAQWRQPAAARRADQRSRRRHAARARRGAARLRGCAVVITHDRWFLDRVATHILAFEGDSQVTWFEGDWAEYADWVRETRGPEALEPHRIKYKPLVRA